MIIPTYDYQHADQTFDEGKCSLGWTFERFEKITADPITACESCGLPIKRLISGGLGFVLAGSGWFRDGYGNPEPAKPAPTSPVEPKAADPATAKDTKTYKKA